MPKQVIWKSEKQIIEKIDKLISMVPILNQEAEIKEHEGLAEKALGERALNWKMVYSAEKKIVFAAKLRRRASRIETVQLPKMKRLLAGFRTASMPFLEDDHIVMSDVK